MRTTERPPGGVQSGGVSLQCGFVHRRSDAVVDVDVSVIAPAFNELENMEPLVERIREVFEPTGMKYEAVIVDDCSTFFSRSTRINFQMRNSQIEIGFKVSTKNYQNYRKR